jgi:hypothetical protein
MKTYAKVLAAAVVAIAGTSAYAEGETPVESKVRSVALFKNGLAVITRTVTVPGPGVYRVDDVPDPVHGTFWIESDAEVETRVTTRVVDAPAAGMPNLDFQHALAGARVRLQFRDGRSEDVVGVMEEAPPETGANRQWSRSYEQYRRTWWRGYSDWPGRPTTGPRRDFLVLRTDSGRSYVDRNMIACVHVEGPGDTVRVRRSVLLFTVGGMTETPGTIVVTYLSKGVAWAPSYRVDISDPKTLVLEQKAVIKNELLDIDDVEVELISGYPNVEFGHVISPLSMTTNWAQFFGQLNRRIDRGGQHALLSNVVTQQAVGTQPRPGAEVDMSAMPTGDGVDLYYHSIGKRTLQEGDSLSMRLARASAEYERIVEWVIPDARNEWGQYYDEWYHQQHPEQFEDSPWDALRFRNPFAFPMTTGPAMIMDGGRFNGQALSHWVNRGEQTVVRVNKALSVRTRSVEWEEKEGRRDVINYGGHNYREVPVKGELTINNHRDETVTVVIRRCFSGALIAADESPKVTPLERGVYSVNQFNELKWTVTIKAGEEKKLTYRYEVLVRH